MIPINIEDTSAANFELDQDQLRNIIATGKVATQNFFQKYEIRPEGVRTKTKEATTEALIKLIKSEPPSPARGAGRVKKTLDAVNHNVRLWEKYPGYLAANEDAIGRGATIRRLFIVPTEDRCKSQYRKIWDIQHEAQIVVYIAEKERIDAQEAYKALRNVYNKEKGVNFETINVGLFDKRSGERSLDYTVDKDSNQVQILFDKEEIDKLDPSGLFELKDDIIRKYPALDCS